MDIVDKKWMKAYYETYNRSITEAISKYYTDDAVFAFQDLTLNGRDAILNHFDGFQKAIKETMTPSNIVIDGDRVAVEVDSRMEVKADLPDFLGSPRRAGELIRGKFSAFYDIRDSKISSIRIYSFQ